MQSYLRAVFRIRILIMDPDPEGRRRRIHIWIRLRNAAATTFSHHRRMNITVWIAMKRVVGEWHGTGMQLIKLILQYSVMPNVVRFSSL